MTQILGNSPFNSQRALDLLRQGTGNPAAEFHEHQELAIQKIVEGSTRVLVIQRTGWGKSFVYFIATKLLRENGGGTAILISPLLALMRNQIDAAKKMGVNAQEINSENETEWEAITEEVSRGEVDILLISPERLANQRFTDEILSKIGGTVSLLVIDEAHCISDWGHDFRPDYRRIENIIRFLPPNLKVLGTTATANNRVMNDLEKVLGPNLLVIKGDLTRESLTLQTIKLEKQSERMAWISDRLKEINGTGIIYTLTVKDAVRLSKWLISQGFDVGCYTSEEEATTKVELERALIANEIKALVATTALGMGYDKPDLSFVIHYQAPQSVVGYYQQVGRAGRALETAYGVLLSGKEEMQITDWFIDTAFPTITEVEELLRALKSNADGLRRNDFMNYTNIKTGRIEKILKILSLESPAPIIKDGNQWRLTGSSVSQEFWDRVERLTSLRREEVAEMQEYVKLPFGSHMEFLIRKLDGDISKIPNPTLPALSEEIESSTLKKAEDFLSGLTYQISPRKTWPTGGLPKYGVFSTILKTQRSESGRSLSEWGDRKWWKQVNDGKYLEHHFPDTLLNPFANLINDSFSEDQITWMTCIPSLRRPDLLPDFMKRLSVTIGLPFLPVIYTTELRPEQKTMNNSYHQARNLDGAFGIVGKLPTGNVLLIDDMVDSRWTITVAAFLLRTHGSGLVFPATLSMTSNG